MPDDPSPVTTLETLLRSMDPALHDGVYVFAVAPADADLAALSPVATCVNLVFS